MKSQSNTRFSVGVLAFLVALTLALAVVAVGLTSNFVGTMTATATPVPTTAPPPVRFTPPPVDMTPVNPNPPPVDVPPVNSTVPITQPVDPASPPADSTPLPPTAFTLVDQEVTLPTSAVHVSSFGVDGSDAIVALGIDSTAYRAFRKQTGLSSWVDLSNVQLTDKTVGSMIDMQSLKIALVNANHGVMPTNIVFFLQEMGVAN